MRLYLTLFFGLSGCVRLRLARIHMLSHIGTYTR